MTNFILLFVGFGIAVTLVVVAVVIRTGVGGVQTKTSTNIRAITSSIGRKVLSTVLLILTGVVIFLWKIYTPGLQPAQVGSWSWNHLLWLLVFFGIIIALARINAKALGGAATTLQVAVAIAIFVLFVGFPLWFWIASFGGGHQPPRMTSAPEKPRIPLTSDAAWPKLVIPAGGRSTLIPVPVGMHAVINEGEGHPHVVYADGRDCDENCPSGNLIGFYVSNPTNEEITVFYAFSK